MQKDKNPQNTFLKIVCTILFISGIIMFIYGFYSTLKSKDTVMTGVAFVFLSIMIDMFFGKNEV